MTADPALRDRLTRAADLVPIDVGSHLARLHDDRHARVVRQRSGVFAVAAAVALLAVVVIWRLLPLGTASVPAAPSEPSGTLALMTGSVSQQGHPFNFFDLDVPGVVARRDEARVPHGGATAPGAGGRQRGRLRTDRPRGRVDR